MRIPVALVVIGGAVILGLSGGLSGELSGGLSGGLSEELSGELSGGGSVWLWLAMGIGAGAFLLSRLVPSRGGIGRYRLPSPDRPRHSPPGSTG